jgi:hypothetical protein
MRSPLTRPYTLVLAVLIFAASSLSAQKPRPTLDVQTATGKTTFYIGERIALKLIFTSPNDTQYGIAPWSNGRGGEFDFESFDVSPSAGWSDPLATYFAQDFVRTGHGWSWPPLLKSKPVELSIDLNQWVRFEQPGDYRVKVVSHRVSGLDRNGLQSNVLDLHVLPANAEWQDAALKRILQQLSSSGAISEGATADLRYLATPAAIDVMTSELREGYAFIASECSMGLLGLSSSMRDLAIASMNHRIDEPDFPISPLFFSTLSLLHVSAGSTAESIRQQRRAFDAILWPTVFSSIEKKQPSARAETVQTLLGYGRNTSTPEIKSQMASLLSASFLNLDDRSQIDDLRQHWDLLRSPAILPALETLARRSTANYGGAGPYSPEDLKSAAFKRWYELDPAEARSEILSQIGSAAPSLSSQALTFLPAEPLPQFEFLWAEAFVRTTEQLQDDTLASLLVKFGTGAVTSQMIAKLNQPPTPYSCMSRALALAYLVRFSPDDARPLLKREIATRETECNDSLLRWISEHTTAPVLNEVAVETLNKADPGTLQDALQYLKSYGTKSDEKSIWDRYVKWTQTWSGKADILDHPGPGLVACGEVCIGEDLGTALIANQGWLADQTLIARVLHGCVGKQVCERLQEVVRSAAPPYQVVLPDPADPLGIGFTQSYNVAQYAAVSRDLFGAKISQYPPGTRFVLFRSGPVTEDQRKLEDEVEAIFEKSGMSLEKPVS